MFEELKGIQGVRNVKPVIKGNLEKLVELGSQLERDFENRTYFIFEKRPELYERVKKADIEYDEQDIQSLVVALSSQETQNPIVRGVYTGALVSLLTEKNNKEGRRTIVKLDIAGSEFPYLCARAKYADVLMIKNVKGDSIGRDISCNHGRAGIVILQDIIGDYAGWCMAMNQGQAGIIILQDINGDNAGDGISADHGQAGIIILQDITGEYTGLYMIVNYGRAGIISLKNIKLPREHYGYYSLLDKEGKYSSQIREFTDEMVKKYSESRMTFEKLREEIGEFIKRIKSGGEDV